MPNKIKKTYWLFALLFIVAAAFAGGYFVRGLTTKDKKAVSSNAAEQQTWTCSMHPQIQETKPGQCRICGMDLIPVESFEEIGPLGPREISFSPEAIKLMELQTSKAERKFVDAEIRLVGKIEYDETKIRHVTAWAAGRIERLFVDFAGTRVIKGDHMVKLYSPELISAQAEYLQALTSVQQSDSTSSQLVKNSAVATLSAAREKLLLLGLTEKQLEEIKSENKPMDFLTVYAPVGGVVLEKHLEQGTYVDTGTIIYTIADLSEVWVKLDAYESDVDLVSYMQQVEFTTEAYPGRTFKGRITFIPPTLDPKTRTVKLRVNVPNPEHTLKPGMFVRAVVHSKVGVDGVVMDFDFSNKYTCPMHPSVVKENNEKCDICGMDLIKARAYKNSDSNETPQPPLVIPASAPLITGERAVVYVQKYEQDVPVFQGREVVLGLRAGDYYIVKQGLAEGEQVVTRGNFKIDSALQIQAKPSMMNPEKDDVSMDQQGSKEQTQCPVMGGAINKKYFIEYKGKKVYFCCPGCDDLFLENPEKYIDKLPQFKDVNEN